MDYNKQPLDIPHQIVMLKARGLIISDEASAAKILGGVSYFRLANYLRPMEADKETHQFKPNSTFENAVSLYKFDTSLRDLVFRAIGQIEIALRTKMIHHFSIAHGSFWFMEMPLANDVHLFLENLNSVDREIRRSKEEFIKEHFHRYSKPVFPPAWKTLEVVSLGLLSKMYFNFADISVKKKIARDFAVPQHVILESWMASIAALRNYCAHHARIWNRNYPVTPNLPARLNLPWIADSNVPANKLYAQLSCIAYWLHTINETSTFTTDLKALLSAYSNVDTTAMGFPREWEDEPLWE